MNSFIGEICLLPYDHKSEIWAPCEGQELYIGQNPVLFSLLGNKYGGDGVKSFRLPDLRGRVVLGMGQGPGLANYELGTALGTETVALEIAQMPAHGHSLSATVPASKGLASQKGPGGALYANTDDPNEYASDLQPGQPMAADLLTGNTGTAGSGDAHENRMPYLALHYYIALLGVYPPRPQPVAH